MLLTQFLAEFGDGLFNAVTEQNQPVYQGQTYPHLEEVMDNLERPLFVAQREVVRAVLQQLVVEDRFAEGVQVVICHPELVKTSLDLLAFPTIYFMQTGYNVYALMQAARRSWRISQKKDVEVYFARYSDTAQQICLELMGRKIAVPQSTSDDMPGSGLDILNQVEDSVEVELAKRLLEKNQN